MNSYEIISALIMPVTLLYMLLFAIVLGHKYIKLYTRNKMLKFTQGEVKEKRREIKEIFDEMKKYNSDHVLSDQDDKKYECVIRVFFLYNELAVGIAERLYDEAYIRMVMGYDMIDFYKSHYKLIILNTKDDRNSSRFLPLELLLKRWDADSEKTNFSHQSGRYL